MNHYANEMYRNEGGRHYSFAQELLKKGYSPTIICASSFHNKEDFLSFDGPFWVDKKNGVTFVFIKTPIAINNGIDRIKNMVSFYLKTRFYAKKIAQKTETPDVILASSVHPLTLVAGIQIAKKFNIKCICEVRDLWPEAIFSYSKKVSEDSFFGKLLIRGEHWIYIKAHALIFTKEGDIDYLKEHQWLTSQKGDVDDEKCFYINNGVDIEKFEENARENVLIDEDLDVDSFTVLYAGSIRPVNNIGKLVEAASYLQKKNIQILVYGDGNEKNQLEAIVENKNLNNIIFKGYVKKKYIPYILSKSNLNILNYSQDEYNWSRGNSSNKLFEYLASGTPILATVKMGYSIIDRYNCGIELFNPSGETIANEILKFESMDEGEYLRLCYNARNASKEFDFEILTDKLVGVLDYIEEKKNIGEKND